MYTALFTVQIMFQSEINKILASFFSFFFGALVVPALREVTSSFMHVLYLMEQKLFIIGSLDENVGRFVWFFFRSFIDLCGVLVLRGN